MPIVRQGIWVLVLTLAGCGPAGRGGAGGGNVGIGSAPGGSFGAAGAGASGGAGTGASGAWSDGAAGSSAIACTIAATATLAAAMPNVAIVTWSTTLTTLTGAEIDFVPAAGGAVLAAPVDLTQPDYRTPLLGMKPGQSYAFRIVARAAGGSCTSDTYQITTGALPRSPPAVSATIVAGESHDRGFIVTSTGLMGNTVFVIDPDGDVVWAATGPSSPSRAHLSWDGTRMYMMALNVRNTGMGNVASMAMDGTGTKTFSGLTASHHDLAAIPGGFATLLWNKSGTDAPCSLVEVTDGTGAITTVVADMGTVYNSSTFHTNSVHYYPGDDTYTVGDRNPDLFVKLTRDGRLLWQFGGGNPKDQTKFFTGVPTWSVSHGHQLLPDGTFLFFNNGANEAWAYALDTTAMKARKILGYTAGGAVSSVLGDVQRLPNGNFLVTFSTSGQIHEISPSGALVAKFTSGSFGYAEFRESLYGPPPY